MLASQRVRTRLHFCPEFASEKDRSKSSLKCLAGWDSFGSKHQRLAHKREGKQIGGGQMAHEFSDFEALLAVSGSTSPLPCFFATWCILQSPWAPENLCATAPHLTAKTWIQKGIFFFPKAQCFRSCKRMQEENKPRATNSNAPSFALPMDASTDADALFNFGNQLDDEGRFDEAIDAYQRSASISREFGGADQWSGWQVCFVESLGKQS